MIVPVMAISNLVLTRQIYSKETNGAHAHNRDRVPLNSLIITIIYAPRCGQFYVAFPVRVLYPGVVIFIFIT